MSVFPSRACLPSDGCSAEYTTGGHEGRLRSGEEIARAARSFRIALLTAALLAMSVVDLYITLLYLDAFGLAEENPLARAVMSHGSTGLLAGWKFLTVLPTLLILIRYRHRVSAELLGWVATAILLGVTLRWSEYADQTDLLMISMPALESGVDHRWVTVPD